MDEKYFLIIDQGGHATRATVLNESAKVICYTESKIETQVTNELEVEHDALEVLNSVFVCIDDIYKALGNDYSKIVKAGLATQRSSIVCWNKKTGKALSPILSWQDRRTASDIVQFKDKEAFIHKVTGLYLNPHYGATKIRWCLQNLSAVAAALENDELYIAPLASYILFHLLDNSPFLIDPANASRTLLMNYRELQWQPELLNLFSIPEKVLPELVTTNFNFGVIRRHQHAIELEICTGDQSAAIYSEGDLPRNAVFINAGTGAFIIKMGEGVPALKEEKLLASVVYADKQKTHYVIEGTVNGAGRALNWFADQKGMRNYELDIDKWSKKITPSVFINAISGIGSPFWVANTKSYFLNNGNDEEKMLAILESIVFLITENINCMRRISNVITEIIIAGGLSNSQAFCQKMANMSCCKVRRAIEKEATTMGVYFLLTNNSNSNVVDNSVLFQPEYDEMLEDRYTLWCKVMSGIVSH